MGFRLAILLCLILVSFRPAWGCFAAPEGILLTHEESIDRSEVIFLGKAIAVTYDLEGMSDIGDGPREATYPYLYKFEIERCLKGVCENVAELRGEHPVSADLDYSWTGLGYAQRSHDAPIFWMGTRGRLSSDTSCGLRPTFELGRSYLIFSEPELSFGAELIAEDDDAWLEYVDQYVNGAKPRKLYPKFFSEYLSGAEGVAIVDARSDNAQIEIIKGRSADFAFLLNPIENTWKSSILPCEGGDTDRYDDHAAIYLLVIEKVMLGERRVAHFCDASAVYINYTNNRSGNPTLSEAGLMRFGVENGEVLLPDGLFTAPLPKGLSKNAVGPKINKIAVDDLRQILESYQDKPEADK